MIDEKLLDQMLDKLLAKTKESALAWQSIPRYLQENHNEPLRLFIIEYNRYAYDELEGLKLKSNTKLISEYQSQCLNMNDGVITIVRFEQGDGRSECGLAVQEHKTSPVSVVDCNKGQLEKVEQLLTLTNSSQYGITNYIRGIAEGL